MNDRMRILWVVLISPLLAAAGEEARPESLGDLTAAPANRASASMNCAVP